MEWNLDGRPNLAAMSFAFNFSVSDSDCSSTAPTSTATSNSNQPQVHHTRYGERFHWTPASNWQEMTEFVPVTLTSPPAARSESSALQFEIVNASDAQFIARTGAISSILTTSDLQAGVYEGGFKLWECALDLVKYMAQHPQFQSMAGKRVTELGCGHALPGIYALQRGAAHVTFMDYNKEVLELTTCPNVLRNVQRDPSLYGNASFYAGAWGSVAEFMATTEHQSTEQQQFDLILTAETIYTEAVAVELFQAIKRHLRRSPNAVALVAAKKYYFGTGGSVQHFMEMVHADGQLQAQVVWEESDGRSNMRAIVQVTHAS